MAHRRCSGNIRPLETRYASFIMGKVVLCYNPALPPPPPQISGLTEQTSVSYLCFISLVSWVYILSLGIQLLEVMAIRRLLVTTAEGKSPGRLHTSRSMREHGNDAHHLHSQRQHWSRWHHLNLQSTRKCSPTIPPEGGESEVPGELS